MSYYQLHKEERLAYQKKYNDKYKEKRSLYGKNWYKKNQETHLETMKRYQKDNPNVSLKANMKYINKKCTEFKMSPSQFRYALQSWSWEIKKLDNNMCKNCDSTENLHAHHIQPKSLFPELVLELYNGITLCHNCHWEIHG